MKKSIVILQDNIRKATALAEEFEKCGKFDIAGVFADGEEGVEVALSESVDYLVTDIEVVSACIEKGAAYYVTKPCDEKTFVRRVTDLFLSEKTEDIKPTTAKTPSLDEKISKIFISVGIPPHIKGYSYLREGIKLAVEDPDVINNITKKLYPMIGEKYDTTPSKVERAIRHAIEVAWARGRINNINDLFGVQTYLAGEKPTNGEFIALIADKMLLEGA